MVIGWLCCRTLGVANVIEGACRGVASDACGDALAAPDILGSLLTYRSSGETSYTVWQGRIAHSV